MGQSNSEKIILDLCGGTGSWSKPYADAGYDVRIIDIKPKFGGKDVRLFSDDYIAVNLSGVPRIYGVLAAPDCSHLAASGARWWNEKGNKSLLEALSVVDACLRIIFISQPHFWCLENPVGRLPHYLGEAKIIFNPCDYGDPYTKKTCLWGKFNIPVKNPVEPIEGSKMHITLKDLAWKTGEERQSLRSITPPGFSQAFFEANK